MRHFSALCVALLFVIGYFIPISTFAHDAHTSIISIGDEIVIPGQPLPIVVPQLPFTLTIAGVVTHEGEGNLNVLELWGTDNGNYFYQPFPYFKGSGNLTQSPYHIPWTIESEGIHILKIESTHFEHDAESQCKAAPAVAASYLRATDTSPNASRPNVIAAVAHETGIHGILSTTNKCNPDYTDNVVMFIVERQ